MYRLTGEQIEFQCILSQKSAATDFHLHDFFEVYLLLEGDINFYVHESCYHIGPGSLLLINDLEVHKAINLSPSPHKRLYFHIPLSFFNKYSTDAAQLNYCFQERLLGEKNLIHLSNVEVLTLMRYFDSMQEARSKKDFGSELLIDSYILQLLILVNRLFAEKSSVQKQAHPYPAKAHMIISFIDEHILEKLTLDQISEQLFLDKYYICHIFKKETGTTIFQYILLKRVAQAKILLSEGRTVTEACYQSGFSDYTNFITYFRKITGYTPKKYQALRGFSK